MKLPEDPFVLELLPEFVDTWIVDLETQFNAAYQAKDADELYRLGHTLKGSCFQFGLDEIANLGIELMGYAKTIDWNNSVELVNKIKLIFNDVKEYLDKNPIQQ